MLWVFSKTFLRSIVPIQSDPGFGNATQFYGVPISKDIKDSVRNLLLLRSTVSYNYLTIIHPFSCNFPLGLCDRFYSMPVSRLLFSTMPLSFMEDLSILLPSLTLILFISFIHWLEYFLCLLYRWWAQFNVAPIHSA